MEALIAVQIVATGLAGLRFLRQSHRHMTEDFMAATPSSCSNCKLDCCKHSIGIGGATGKPSRSTTFTFIPAAKGSSAS
jgi:hypothetical protein